MPVSQSKLAWLTPNLRILWILACSFWLCGSIVANPIIYTLVPSPSRYEIRQYRVRRTLVKIECSVKRRWGASLNSTSCFYLWNRRYSFLLMPDEERLGGQVCLDWWSWFVVAKNMSRNCWKVERRKGNRKHFWRAKTSLRSYVTVIIQTSWYSYKYRHIFSFSRQRIVYRYNASDVNWLQFFTISAHNLPSLK